MMTQFTSPIASTVIRTETAQDTTVLPSDQGNAALKDKRLLVSSWIALKSWWQPTGTSLYEDIPMTSATDCTPTSVSTPPLINVCPDDYLIYARQIPQSDQSTLFPNDWIPIIETPDSAYPPQMVTAGNYPNLKGFDTISFVVDCNALSTSNYNTPLLLSWPMALWETNPGPCYQNPTSGETTCAEGGDTSLMSAAGSYITRSSDSFPTDCTLGTNGDQCERLVFVNCPSTP